MQLTVSVGKAKEWLSYANLYVDKQVAACMGALASQVAAAVNLLKSGMRSVRLEELSCADGWDQNKANDLLKDRKTFKLEPPIMSA